MTIEKLLSSAKRRSHDLVVPPKAIADLKKIASHIEAGHPAPTWNALREYLESTHGVSPGRKRLATVAQENGIDPWWSFT